MPAGLSEPPTGRRRAELTSLFPSALPRGWSRAIEDVLGCRRRSLRGRRWGRSRHPRLLTFARAGAICELARGAPCVWNCAHSFPSLFHSRYCAFTSTRILSGSFYFFPATIPRSRSGLSRPLLPARSRERAARPFLLELRPWSGEGGRRLRRPA